MFLAAEACQQRRKDFLLFFLSAGENKSSLLMFNHQAKKTPFADSG
jgi:hypothetical protein